MFLALRGSYMSNLTHLILDLFLKYVPILLHFHHNFKLITICGDIFSYARSRIYYKMHFS
jgi:hypothetical protein